MTLSESTEVTAYGLIRKYISCASCNLEEKYSRTVVNGSMHNLIERVSLFDFNVYSIMVVIEEVVAADRPDRNEVVGAHMSYAAIRSSRVEGTTRHTNVLYGPLTIRCKSDSDEMAACRCQIL